MPQFQFVGHASVLISKDDFHLLTDPWFGDPFHFNTFHFFPALSPIQESFIKKIDAIHISHIHQDHFSESSLARLSKSILVIISKYSDSKLKDRILSLGFHNILEIDPGLGSVDVGPFQLQTFTPLKFDGSFDSSLLLTCDSKSYYFMNDCRLSEKQYVAIKETPLDIQGCFLGYHHVNPYPTCYRFSLQEKPHVSTRTEIDRMNSQVIEHFYNVCRFLQPKWAAPYAGNIRFLRENILHHNTIFEGQQEKLHPNQDVQKIIHWNPSDVINGAGEFLLKSNPPKTELTVRNSTKEVGTAQEISQPTEDEVETLLTTFIRKCSAKWAQPLNIRFVVQYPQKKQFLNFSFLNGQLLKESRQLDVEVTYSSHSLKRVIDGVWSFREMHYSFEFTATIYTILTHQIWIHKWN